MTFSWQWMAGFLEGEGSFLWGNGVLTIVAYQKDLWALTKLQKQFGGRISENKRCNMWRLSGNKAEKVMLRIKPMMSPRRQAQIEKAFEGRKRQPRWGTPEHLSKITGRPRDVNLMCKCGKCRRCYQREWQRARRAMA